MPHPRSVQTKHHNTHPILDRTKRRVTIREAKKPQIITERRVNPEAIKHFLHITHEHNLLLAESAKNTKETVCQIRTRQQAIIDRYSFKLG